MRSSKNKIKTLNYSSRAVYAALDLHLKPLKNAQRFVASVKSRIQSLQTANLIMISN